ncbi:MAG: NAD(+)/NADH kinase, partial [Chloroflexota bacterium]
MATIYERVGVLAHPLRPQTFPVAAQIAEYLEIQNIDHWIYTRWEESDVATRIHECDLVVAIGGDGAMLRAARVCAPHHVPVLGINMGQLGFLTEIPGPDSWEATLARVLVGEGWIEERMMVHATQHRGNDVVATGDALNDIVISRGVVPRTIRLETYIDSDWATTYNADALVIATATGSTAYALACGGPILPPELRNILIVPVAPHLSMERPIVLSEGATVQVVAAMDNSSEIVLTVDGIDMGPVLPGDTIRVQASQHISRFVRLRERHYFYRSLLDRLEPRVQARHQP